MLRAHCPRHGRAVLIPTGRIHAIDNTEHGLVARWRCTCGHLGSTTFARPAPLS